MSQANDSFVVKFNSKSGTYAAKIMSPSGDLYQEYEGTTDEVTSLYPNFETTKPVLYFVCTSSRVAEGVADPDSMVYYFNETKIEFSGGVSTGIFAGYFQSVAPSGDQLYYGLKILKNIAELAGYAPATIKMVATIAYGTQSDTIQASCNIPIGQSTGSSYRVSIIAGDTKNFVIRDKDGSCILKAMAYQSGETLSSSLSYAWQKMEDGAWEDMTATTQSITVSASDIDTYGQFRVTVSRDSSAIGSDIQGVMDTSDPYVILPGNVPEVMAIDEDSTGVGEIVFTPIVAMRGTTTSALDTLFYFTVTDYAGVILNSDNTTAKASSSVTRAMCLQAGGDINITIATEE